MVEEVGYHPFERDAANLFFQLVSSRYEHASLIFTSNLPFNGWGGEPPIRGRGIDSLPSIRTTTDQSPS